MYRNEKATKKESIITIREKKNHTSRWSIEAYEKLNRNYIETKKIELITARSAICCYIFLQDAILTSHWVSVLDFLLFILILNNALDYFCLSVAVYKSKTD